VVIEIEAPWTVNLEAVLELIKGVLTNAKIPHQAQILATVKSDNDTLPTPEGYVGLEVLMSRYNLGRSA